MAEGITLMHTPPISESNNGSANIRSHHQDKISEKITHKFNQTVKILIVGGKNSGKMTFKNQLKSNYGEGFGLG